MISQVIWSPGTTLEQIEEMVIKKAYQHYKEKNATAAALGIARRTLDYKFEKYEEDRLLREHRAAEKREQEQEFLMRSRGLKPAIPIEPVIQQDVSEELQVTTLRSKKSGR